MTAATIGAKFRLQDWLALQAQRQPGAIAIVCRGGSITYGELDAASNRLAHALIDAGCRRGDRIGLLLPKSIRPILAMFAALKADCIYVPIDTLSPPARIERILRMCEFRVILAEQSTAELLNSLSGVLAQTACRAGWMDSAPEANAEAPYDTAFQWRDVESLSAGLPVSRNEDGDPAHILFTSGSTGIPKGVVITHSNVVHFVRWAVKYFGINETDRNSGHPPLHFDLSTFDIYGTIAAGAQLHLVPPEISLLPHRLAGFIRDARLTQWFSAPSALTPLAKFDAVHPNDFPFLRRLLWCGEKFPVPALIYWMRRLPHVDFVNLYGPTEATIASSYYRVPSIPADDKQEIPIGEACDGEKLTVFDSRMRPAAPGEIGDLYIGGAGLSPGYWRDPEKTRAVFLPDPFSSDPHARIYKTGDLARKGVDGLVYLVGRADSQIKVRGHRIELGEVEAALHAVDGVQDGAVVSIETDELEGPAICCAYVPVPEAGLTPFQLKRKLSATLPRYMIPVRWKILDQMPLNANGKIDRVLLRQWFREGEPPGSEAPRGPAPKSDPHRLEKFGD